MMKEEEGGRGQKKGLEGRRRGSYTLCLLTDHEREAAGCSRTRAGRQ